MCYKDIYIYITFTYDKSKIKLMKFEQRYIVWLEYVVSWKL